uniref:Uncharacterized protein n=1 Tax=Arundo donax TaxID=35708 RepID=A0A0A8ZEG0_ARUDO
MADWRSRARNRALELGRSRDLGGAQEEGTE